MREVASAAVGLRPKRSKSNAFYGNAPHRGAGAQRLRGVPIGGSRKYGEKIFTPNGVNLQYFRLEPTPLGSERGEQPLSRCGERGVQRERGGSRNTPLTLWPSGATPAAMHLAKGIRPAPRDHPLCGKPPSDAASLPRFPTLRIFFFCNFLRDFRLFFRWKAVVDSVQFRVILNITTKRFDVASWHAEMLRLPEQSGGNFKSFTQPTKGA